MLLSTSNFKQLSTRKWFLLACVVFISGTSVIATTEHYWRKQGYIPRILDSALLWSVERKHANYDNSIVFVGASRTQFGIHPPTVKSLLPESEPVMLAVNGMYPLSTLRSLAEDPAFNGIAIVDVDVRGLNKLFWWMQQSYVDYYEKQFTPSLHIHRELLSLWQEYMVISRDEMSIGKSIARLIDGSPNPWKPNYTLTKDRAGHLTFSQKSAERLAKNFGDELEKFYISYPPPPPEQWLADLALLPKWVKRIENRGGKVIFYEPPVSGRQRSIANEATPKEQYWDELMRIYNLNGVNYQDEPKLQRFEQPDDSHISGDSRKGYTKELINLLIEKNLIESPQNTLNNIEH